MFSSSTVSVGISSMMKAADLLKGERQVAQFLGKLPGGSFVASLVAMRRGIFAADPTILSEGLAVSLL
jgi:hypothetical protein